MIDLFNTLLEYYSLTNEEYLELTKPLTKVTLLDPKKIKVMNKVTARISEAITKKEKILIYGDYDCDGFCATSIMVKTFKLLDYPVAFYIPSRYIDGYALNVTNVEKIAKAGFKLIICVDNGISAFDAISKAKTLGIDVIVIDHHDVPKERVEAYEIIHPTVSEISPIVGSGGYMSLFVSGALLGYYDEYLVTLAGLSTVSDLMELKGYNRDVVRLAIDNLDKNRYLPLKLLLSSSIIDEKSFGIDIAPKLNSIGRLIEEPAIINKVVRYLTSEDENEVRSLSEWILDVNEERKRLVNENVITLPSVGDSSGICIITNMKEGLAGLVANKLLTEHNKPSVVFTESQIDKDILKGSIRSKEGFNVTEACKSLKHYLIGGGGHALAGGLEIKKSDFESFKNDFIKLCEENPLKITEKNIEISLQDITFENFEIYRSFAPFGMGFKEPLLLLKNIPTKSLSFISFGKHLSTSLSIRSKILGFNLMESEIKANKSINLYGNFLLSEFRGNKTLEFRVTKYTK